MVAKISDEQLNGLKITSYERAIVFSALTLAGQLNADNIGVNNITINDSTNIRDLPVISVLLIKLSLPFDKEIAYKGIGNFIKSLKEISTNNPAPILLETNEIPIWNYSEYSLPVPTPIWIDTLEEYIFWLVLNYQSEMILNNEINYNLISIKVDFNTGKINLEINLPIDYQKQLQYQNYVVSVTPIYLWNKTIIPVPSSGKIDNNTFMNNSIVIGN